MITTDQNGHFNFHEALAGLDLPIETPSCTIVGQVKRIVGLTIEAVGISAPIGAQCLIESQNSHSDLLCEVIGFDGDLLFLMPLESIEGISPGSRVVLRSEKPLGSFSLKLQGRVIDGIGQPIDGMSDLNYEESVSLDTQQTSALEKASISEALETGVKAIDSCFTFGKGQRMGLIAGSGVGKSVLLAMLAQNTAADVLYRSDR